MNIRMKVVSLLALLFVVLICIEIAVQREVLMPSFGELERDDARVSMRRIDYALDMALDGLQVTAADWGNWEDVYRYVQSPSAAFVSTNITPTAMKQLQVNALVIVDLEGNVVLSTAQELSGASMALDFTRQKMLPANFPWRANLASGKPAKGLIRTDHGVMMLAAAPVLDGSGGGKALGLVFMGELLTAEQVRKLGARAQAELSLLQDVAMGERLTETDAATQIDQSFEDIYGRPVMTLRVEVPRRITERGHVAVTYAS